MLRVKELPLSSHFLLTPGALLLSPACLRACSISPPGKKRKETAATQARSKVRVFHVRLTSFKCYCNPLHVDSMTDRHINACALLLLSLRYSLISNPDLPRPMIKQGEIWVRNSPQCDCKSLGNNNETTAAGSDGAVYVLR